MASTPTLTLTFLLLLLALSATDAATFTITNRCSSTLWPSAVPGGGRQLDPGQTWTLDIPNGTYNGLIWARTACTFDATGRGTCQTGDCGGLLNCTAVGSSPLTLAVYSVNQFKNLDWYDISLVGGFNVPMELASTSGGCHDIKCAADITGQCPEVLRAPGGCNNPCTVFKTEEYCCTTGSDCGPTEYSRFFKNLCPEVYSYPRDDQTSLFTCPGGGDYRVAFCP